MRTTPVRLRRELMGSSTWQIGRPTGLVADDWAIGRPALSATGQYVAFTSRATNLDTLTAPDGGAASRVYLRDLNVEGETELVSRRDGSCTEPQFIDCTDRGQQPGSITDDGRFVSFASNERLAEYSPGGGFAAYVRDRQAGTTAVATLGNSYSDPCNPDSGCEAVPDAPLNGDVVSPPLLSPLSGPGPGEVRRLRLELRRTWCPTTSTRRSTSS